MEAGRPSPGCTTFTYGSTVQIQFNGPRTHLGVVLAARGGRKDEPGREGGAHVELLGGAGAQVVSVGGGAAGACKSSDAVRALVDDVDQSC